jgi:hypothetical protein
MFPRGNKKGRSMRPFSMCCDLAIIKKQRAGKKTRKAKKLKYI